MKRCPKCGHNEFQVEVLIKQIWNVDENGDRVSIEDDCSAVYHKPGDLLGLWTCNECGHTDYGCEFNVE